MDNEIYDEVRGAMLGVLADMNVENTHRAFVTGYYDHDGEHQYFDAGFMSDFFPGETYNSDCWFEDGWELLGAGAFSLAFKHPRLPEGQIIKVSVVAADIGPAYWAYCLDHAGEPYVPNVIEHGHDKLTGWRWCIMEECVTVTADESAYVRDFFHEEAPEIYQWAASLGCVDLHCGNVMRSVATKALVITDPVSLTQSMRQRVWGC